MKKKSVNKQAMIYQAENGAIALRGDHKKETIWATQKEMAQVFSVTSQNITLHLKKIYKDQELEEEATCKDYLQVQIEGERKIKRKVKEYNLDVIISVGYRINSVTGTEFRKWATKTLKEHITQGYTINPQVVRYNYDHFIEADELYEAVATFKNERQFSSERVS